MTQVLDEPTNHLDLQTVQALSHALKDGTDSKLDSHVAQQPFHQRTSRGAWSSLLTIDDCYVKSAPLPVSRNFSLLFHIFVNSFKASSWFLKDFLAVQNKQLVKLSLDAFVRSVR